jgi:hypothetical protein
MDQCAILFEQAQQAREVLELQRRLRTLKHGLQDRAQSCRVPAVADTFTVIDVASCDSLSHHESEDEARAAVRRYEQAGTRRKWGQV